MKFLALDFGQKRIGMALCDADERFAFAHKTLERKPNDNRGDMAAIISVIRLNDVEGVVCGVPGGSEKSDQTAQVAARFFEKLRAEATTQGFDLEWHEWDERFSTSAYLTQLRESGASFKRAKENNQIDSGAAAMMLEGFLASRRGHSVDRESEDE